MKTETGTYEYGLAEVLQIRPIWFEYNGLAGTVAGEKHAGVIAQELERVAPRLVNHERKPLHPGAQPTDVLSVRYEEFDMMLIRAVQEQQKLLKRLKCQLERQHKLEAASPCDS
ncbi:MAG: tail fiber domain-containing protein [Proteobacteria bacterium]|nr:MAG: tail fiber domain-containing protein [Pseudomonadota bacterium]